jgi:hypothetical protein
VRQALSKGREDLGRLRFPSWRSVFYPHPEESTFKTELDAIALRLSIATLVYERGWKKIAGDPVTSKLATALTELETVATQENDKTKAADRIAEILKAYNAPADGSSLASAPPADAITERSIEASFTRLNYLAYVLWILLTLIGGYYALILDKGAFGILRDYIICFFWGVGLSTVADQLSPAGIMKIFSVTTPQPAMKQ